MSLSFAPVPTFGFGVAGPLATPLVSQAQVTDLVRHALDLGIRVFDTAPLYGNGLGEKRLGKALSGVRREDFILTTKAGVTGGKVRDFSPDAIAASVHASLSRLGVGYVDVLFLHGADPAELTDELLARLHDLQEQGLIRRLGAAGRGDELTAALQACAFDALMLPMGPDASKTSHELAYAAKAQGASVFGIEMLGQARQSGFSLRPADWWQGLRQWKHGKPPVTPARKPNDVLRAALDTPHVDVVLSTSSRKNHLDDWWRCLDERAMNP